MSCALTVHLEMGMGVSDGLARICWKPEGERRPPLHEQVGGHTHARWLPLPVPCRTQQRSRVLAPHDACAFLMTHLWGVLSSHLWLDCRGARSHTAYGMRAHTHGTCTAKGDADGAVTDRRVTSYNTRYKWEMARPVPTWRPVTLRDRAARPPHVLKGTPLALLCTARDTMSNREKD